LAIFLVELECVNRGYKLLDGGALKKRANLPAEPDVFVEIDEKYHKGSSIVHSRNRYVIEVETNPTKDSVIRKIEQYTRSPGITDVLFVMLNELKHQENWQEIKELINKVIP
jgi:hypothetical protein